METVRIIEVGPRDGLQSIAAPVPTETKINLINALSQSGLKSIEVTSFVNPNRVPQLADATEVMGGIQRSEGVRYGVLVPNMHGLNGALAAQADEIAVFIAASEAFSRANLGCDIETSLIRLEPVIEAAKRRGFPVRGYLSCITHCPYDGATEPKQVAGLTRRLLDMGCYEISLGETLGNAFPEDIERVLTNVTRAVPSNQLAGHFHDTKGRGLANVEVALAHGIRTFDSSVAGLGGCPFAPGAAGNVNTRHLAELVHDLGFQTNVDLQKLKAAETIAVPFAKHN
ncbi:MAG: hydroxymethylglutaryl-CoA lyase [Pseudomonadota bacterium]